VLADQAKATWLFPGVAVSPLGADGPIGAEGDEPPPPHAANARVDSPSSDPVDPSVWVVAPVFGGASAAMRSSRGGASSPTMTRSSIAMRFPFIARGIPGTNSIAIPY